MPLLSRPLHLAALSCTVATDIPTLYLHAFQCYPRMEALIEDLAVVRLPRTALQFISPRFICVLTDPIIALLDGTMP